jgi:hypothetical protein
MKRFVTSVALACVVCLPVFAGDVPTVGAPAPPPGPNGMSSNGRSLAGDIPSVGFADQISNEALSALLTALSSVMV